MRVLTFERRIFSGVLRAERGVVRWRERRSRGSGMCIVNGEDDKEREFPLIVLGFGRILDHL